MSDFKVLDDREHIILRANMYIGSTSLEKTSGIINFKHQQKDVVPALLKIINEVIDNSVDEFIRTNGQFAQKISVDISTGIEGCSVSVTDDGRGIPVIQHDGKYQAELAWTRARAGSNFTGDHRVTIGMNGVGSFATNCFSTYFEGKSGDGSQMITVLCSDNASKVKTTKKASAHRGTSVKFFPDLEKFGLTEITRDHLDVIEDRLTNLAICYPSATFKFNGKKIAVKNHTQLAKQFHEEAISFESVNEKCVFVVAPAGADEEFRTLSYVNGLNMKNGGSHIDAIINGLTSELIPAIKRKWKIEVLPNQIKQHLLFASWISDFPNPKFDSQSKERLTNTAGEIRNFVEIDYTKIARKILNTESIITPMIEAILHKKELAEKREANAALKKVQKKKIANHLAATDPDWRKRTLYIAEGLSAIGALITIRDPKKHGGYALRGKVMNTYGMKDVDILKNKELSELLTIIGLDLSTEKFTELNYGRIVIMTDQDYDGFSISCLLLQFFSKWPALFERGMICRLNTPLYVARKKGVDDKYYYTKEEFDAASSGLKGFEIDFMKGLGSLTTKDYKFAIYNPVLTVIQWSGRTDLDMAFGDSADGRKEWMMSR